MLAYVLPFPLYIFVPLWSLPLNIFFSCLLFVYSILLLLPPFLPFPVLFLDYTRWVSCTLFPESLVFEMHACGLETTQSVLIDFPLSILQFVVVMAPFQFNSFHFMDVISQPSSLGNCLHLLLGPPFDLFVSHSNVYSCVAISTLPGLFISISHLYLFVFYYLSVHSSWLPWFLLVFEEVSYHSLFLFLFFAIHPFTHSVIFCLLDHFSLVSSSILGT